MSEKGAGLPIQSNPIDNPIQSIHIWTIDNPRYDNRLFGSQSNRNNQSIIYHRFFWIVFGLIIRVLRLIFVCIFDIPPWKLQ